jgi:hypothetical protein
MPASAAVRTGLVTATALTLALLAGSPALADDLPELQIGAPCDAELAQVLPAGWTCDGDVLSFTPVIEPPPVVTEPDPPAEPTPEPSLPADPPPLVIDPPVDVPPVVIPIPGTPDNAAPQPGTNTPGKPTVPGGSLSENAKDAKDGDESGLVPAAAPAPGRSLLSAATVSTLASSDLPTLAAMRAAPLPIGSAGSPLSAYMPTPVLANLPPNAALAAVQAPLLAAGDDAAGSGGFSLAGLDSKALPGLLVVLATALVAAVGAGNLRAWQERVPQWRRAYARRR